MASPSPQKQRGIYTELVTVEKGESILVLVSLSIISQC